MLPVFTQDMNNLALSENTPVGDVVYRLQGVDPEGLPVSNCFVRSLVINMFPATSPI